MKKICRLAMVVMLLAFALPQTRAQNACVPEWYRGSRVVSADGSVNEDSLSQDKIDLLYIVSTEVIKAVTADGKQSYQSLLTPEDRSYIDGELEFAEKNIACGDFNYLAPYYHQFTFESINLPKPEFQGVFRNVTQEMCDIFDYYLKNVNGGRKYALVGFSQGAMLVVELLKHSTKEQLRNMVGAYLLGFGLSAEDLKCENITPATGAEGWGHVVSFNSVLDKNATWPVVHNNSVTVINPVNWQTTSEPASFDFEGNRLSVSVDCDTKQLIVTVPDKTPYHEYMRSNPAYKMAGVSVDCLHRWDLLYYTKMIHDNILLRAGNTVR